MESKRSDNRRRRVLCDEAVQQAPAVPDALSDGSTGKRRRSNNYPRGNYQLKTSDLIPTRWLSFGLIAASSILLLGVVNLLDWLATRPSTVLDGAAAAALGLTAPNGLAAWLTIVVYFLACLFALQTFAIRRHRRDDYRGTYRVWLALAAVLLLASLQNAVPLDHILGLLVTKAIQLPAFASVELAGISLKIFLLFAIAGRLFIEIRHCRLASLLLVVSLAAHALVALWGLPAVQTGWLANATWLTNNLPLFGALAVLHCVLAYSRFVCLDAQGMLSRRVSRKRKRKRKSRVSKQRSLRSQPATPASESPRSQPAPQPVASTRPATPTSHSTSKPAAPTPPTQSRDASKLGPLASKINAMKSNTNISDDDEDWEDDDSDSNSTSQQRLSKAERRRLKKLHRQRHAA